MPRIPFHSANLSRTFFVKLPQTRHPERSASQIDRVTQRLWRGVEEPVPRVAEGTSRCLFCPCCSELFNHRARTGLFPWGREPELASISLCPVSTPTFSATIQARFTLASPATCISVSCNLRKARGKVSLRPMAASAPGFGGRRAPSSMGKISTAGVPSATLGAGSSTPRHKRCVTRSTCEALRSG
jgi:hypothetical protein